MKSRHEDYRSRYDAYIEREPNVRFTSSDEIKEKYTHIKIGEPVRAGGMPVLTDGEDSWVNTENVHTAVIGATGSMKTRACLLPAAINAIHANESLIIFDIKGELSSGSLAPYLRGELDDHGYETILLDFRNFSADVYNILQAPIQAYRSGNKSEAMKQISDIASVLAAPFIEKCVDIYWGTMSKEALIICMTLLVRYCREPEKINFLSIADLLVEENFKHFENIASLLPPDTISTMIKGILTAAEKTLASILVSTQGCLEALIGNEDLLKMISSPQSWKISGIYERKTALFFIIPDECDTHKSVINIILSQIFSTLISDAGKLGGDLPRRVNILMDEFANFNMPGIDHLITAARSRNMTFTIYLQSKKQLENAYDEKVAEIILSNCTDILFLNSTESGLLEFLSNKAGKVYFEDGYSRPLISISDLQSLKKDENGKEVYFSSNNTHFVATFPDISKYPHVQKHEGKKYRLEKKARTANVPIYTALELAKDIKKSKNENELEAKLNKLLN